MSKGRRKVDELTDIFIKAHGKNFLGKTNKIEKVKGVYCWVDGKTGERIAFKNVTTIKLEACKNCLVQPACSQSNYCPKYREEEERQGQILTNIAAKGQKKKWKS
jgi:hypothetical protein